MTNVKTPRICRYCKFWDDNKNDDDFRLCSVIGIKKWEWNNCLSFEYRVDIADKQHMDD
jgi:hypothetical protein